MTTQEFNDIVTEFCGDEKILFKDELNIPYRTFQDYLYGKRKIPDHIAQKALDSILSTRKFMKQISASVDKHQPHGVPNLAVKGEW